MHRGPEVQSEHYKAFLSLGEGRWVDTDDNRPGQLADDTQLAELWENAYLLVCTREGSDGHSAVPPEA